MGHYLISDEMQRQYDDRKAAEFAFDVRTITEDECEVTIARAKDADVFGGNWRGAKEELLKARARTNWSDACDLSRGNAEALTLLKECVVKYRIQEKRHRVLGNAEMY